MIADYLFIKKNNTNVLFDLILSTFSHINESISIMCVPIIMNFK